MDIAGVVVAFETELSVTDLLVPEFGTTPIATAASPAVTHMTARRIGAQATRAPSLFLARDFDALATPTARLTPTLGGMRRLSASHPGFCDELFSSDSPGP